jgi:DNA-binding IclR family transcriptional regulator
MEEIGAKTAKYNIPILTKGMGLLELLAGSSQGLTIQEMVDRMKHSKTSVYRMVCSLEEMGYLRKEESTGRFLHTRKMFRLGLATMGMAAVTEYAYEPMRRLRDALKETVVLGMLERNRVVIMDQVLGSHHFSFIVKPGMEICLHASAPGKVLLAYLDPEERNDILGVIEYTAYNSRTITSREALEAELDRTRTDGFGLDWGEELAGVHCIGAPVFNAEGKVVAAIWITGPSERISKETRSEYGAKVRAYADMISHKMGYETLKI